MENIDVLCINCENMISLDKISLHSSICLAPTAYILKLNDTNPSKMLDFRLDKLKCSLECILQENLKPLTIPEKQIFSSLIELSSEVLKLKDLSNENLENLEKSEKIQVQMNSFSFEDVSPCVTIYAERLKTMANQKIMNLKHEAKLLESSMSVGLMIRQRQSQLEGLNKEIMKFKQSAGDLDGILECVDINSVVDDLNSKRSASSSVLSPKDAGRFETDELDLMFKDQERANKERSAQDLQKYFYSKCLVMKLGFSSRDPAQFIQIPDLYRAVRQSGLAVEKWEEYIREQFNNPQTWVKK
jgi:hypothetical protein